MELKHLEQATRINNNPASYRKILGAVVEQLELHSRSL